MYIQNVNVKEEMLALVAFIKTIHSIDIKNTLVEEMNRFDSPYNKLVSVATDRAPVMIKKNLGLIGLLNNDLKILHFLPLHCIIYSEHLIAKYFKYEMCGRLFCRLWIWLKQMPKTHRQFKNFLDKLQVNNEIDGLPSDLACVVRWLSTIFWAVLRNSKILS